MTTLTMKDEKRLDVIQRVYRSELTVVEAARTLGLSERQCYRIKARVKKSGAKGVVHGNRGRPCKCKIEDQVVRRIVGLALGKYQGFNDHHLTDKLKEQESIDLSREKVRRVLRAEGIRSPKKRRGLKHRSRRERRAAEGMMLQIDGSPHDWLEGRGPRLCLIGAIDDATSKVMGALFVEAESSWGYFRLFSEVFHAHGVSQSIYTDRHSVFWTDRQPTIEEQLINKKPATEVGRALEELGVTLILANSPQAKGRIERMWNTFQDRLVSELRLARPRPWNRPKRSWSVTSPSTTVSSPNRLRLYLPGERSARCRSNERCVSNSSASWPRTTRLASKGRCYRFPRPRPFVPTLTEESRCMSFSTVRWRFSTSARRSQPSTPQQRTQLACIEP